MGWEVQLGNLHDSWFAAQYFQEQCAGSVQ